LNEKGNYVDWWKEEDLKRFEEKTKAMAEQYDGLPYHGGKVNGTMVVSENIADNGGMAVTLEIMHTLEKPDFTKYFVSWATVWRSKAKEGYIRLLLKNDVHSPDEIRANRTVLNFPEWYDTFSVKETDGMYLPEEKRLSIW
ncbi:MAG: M13 family peptidase, partial [Clostridia bacterium]|nr:M13 family peptidase [Clostridia bacterium]